MMEKGFLGKFLAHCLLLAIFAGASGPAFAAEIRDIRMAATEQGIRVVLDLSGPVKHSAFLLDDPGRVVLDVSRSTLKTPLPAAAGPITLVRSGKLPNSGLRLVFEVRGPVSIETSTLAPAAGAGNRLVLDISERGAAKAQAAIHQEV